MCDCNVSCHLDDATSDRKARAKIGSVSQMTNIGRNLATWTKSIVFLLLTHAVYTKAVGTILSLDLIKTPEHE